jgi:hypothetical protein
LRRERQPVERPKIKVSGGLSVAIARPKRIAKPKLRVK